MGRKGGENTKDSHCFVIKSRPMGKGTGEISNPYLSIRFAVHPLVTSSLSRFVPRSVRLFDIATRPLFVVANGHQSPFGYDLLPCFRHCGSNISDTLLPSQHNLP